MISRLLLLLGLQFVASASAGELESLSVEHTGNLYKMEVVMLVDVRQEAAIAILSDHQGLARVSDMLVKSDASVSTTGEVIRMLNFDACLLFFCLQFQINDTVLHSGPNRIYTKFIPEHSDFNYGITEWTVQELDNEQTRIHFYTEMQPGFWIPPVIGPALIKAKLAKEAKASVANIERIARLSP